MNSLLWLYRTWWFKPFSWVLPMGWKLHVRSPWLLLARLLRCHKACIVEHMPAASCCTVDHRGMLLSGRVACMSLYKTAG